MENEIEKTLACLFDAIQTENEQESNRLLREAVQYVQNSKRDLHDPEMFNLFIRSKLKDAVEVLATALHEPTVCKDKYKANFIYESYGFLERNIEKLCEMREGSGCSGDKSRYILKMYLNYAITGHIPPNMLQKGEYWKPKFGDNEMWMAFCDSLYRLNYGYTKEYFEAYNILLQCHVAKFCYTIHHWFIEFTDGQIVEFDRTWDEKTENPLNSRDKGDFYLMYGGKFPDKVFEKYIPEPSESFLMEGYVKIPKSEIVRVFKESNEEMI